MRMTNGHVRQVAPAFTFNLRFSGQVFNGQAGLHYNYFRDFDPATGMYAESDPMGLNAGVNTYAYVQSDPIGSGDPLGLVKRGLGWSNPQWSAIKQAESRIRQELGKGCSCPNGGGKSCIPCEVAKGLVNALNTSEVVEAPLLNPDAGRSDCGVGGIPGSRVFLSPAAFTKRCDCLASTLYHELLHNAGLDHDPTTNGPGVTDLEKRCMGNLCNRSTP
jgi:RHS repeat-associated protein